jgi:hypothetical protein
MKPLTHDIAEERIATIPDHEALASRILSEFDEYGVKP